MSDGWDDLATAARRELGAWKAAPHREQTAAERRKLREDAEIDRMRLADATYRQTRSISRTMDVAGVSYSCARAIAHDVDGAA